jgi:hypothetical protein
LAAEWSVSLGGTGNPVPNSRARAGLSRTQKEGHARWASVMITRDASLQIQGVELCTLLDRIHAVGRDVNWGGGDASKRTMGQTG